MGKTVPQPPYSPDLAPCDFWLFPKLRSCRYETIEEMKETVTKVIDTLAQEDFRGTFQTFFERYNKFIAAGGDYFERDWSFMCVLSIKVPIRKNSGNLFNNHCIYIYIYIYHHVVLVARISLTLSRHSSLSFIALGTSSGQHPVSSHSCWIYVRAGRPAFARPWVGVHKSTRFVSNLLKMLIDFSKRQEKERYLSILPKIDLRVVIWEPWNIEKDFTASKKRKMKGITDKALHKFKKTKDSLEGVY